MLSLLLFLALVTGLEGLSCVDVTHSFRVLRKDFDWNKFTSYANESISQIEAINDDDVCRVTVHVDYNAAGDDYINVAYGNVASDTCDYVEFGTTFTSEKSQTSMVSYIDYVCSSGNFCELTFINAWIKRLLGTDTNPLHNSITYLLSESTESSEPPNCYWDNIAPSCVSHLCFALYEELSNVPLKNSSCLGSRPSGSIYIYVTTKLIESEQRVPIEINYQCKKNQFSQEVSYDFNDHQRLSQNTYASSCSPQSFTSSPTNLRSDDFSLSLVELDHRIKTTLDHVDRCDVYMEADYRQDDGHLTLRYDQPKTETNQHTSFDMMIAVENSTASLWSSMYHTCVPPFQCDRKLVSKWIQWLIDINKQTVLIESNLLSEGYIQSYKCKIWSHSLSDTIDVCFGYSYEKAESNNPTTTPADEISSDGTNIDASMPKSELQNISCSRLHEKPNEVYRYVLAHLVQRCTPSYLLKSADIVADLPTELSSQYDQSADVQTVTADSVVKPSGLKQLITNLRPLPLASSFPSIRDPTNSLVTTDELVPTEDNSLAEDEKTESDAT